MTSQAAKSIDLSSPLSFGNSFMFPLQSSASRRDVLMGALWLLVPVVGWVMNMGHRILIVHRMMNHQEPWPAWNRPMFLLKHGGITLAGMIVYYLPAAGFGLFATAWRQPAMLVASSVCFVLATLAIPGFMSHYCLHLQAREIFNPFRALRRCIEGGKDYWHAWAIALSALGLSFLGLLGLGIGFLITSVWFWQAAGFSFATAFSQRHGLGTEPSSSAE